MPQSTRTSARTTFRFASPPHAVIDACVLFSQTRRELLMHLATKGLFQPLWSPEILDEASRNIVKRSEEKHARDPAFVPIPLVKARGIFRILDTYLPDAAQPAPSARTIARFRAVHWKDRHVVATALEAKLRAGFAATPAAQAHRKTQGVSPTSSPRFGVVTENLQDFPAKSLLAKRLFVGNTDAFVLSLLAWSGREVIGGICAHMVGLQRPPLTLEEYVDKLAKADMHETRRVVEPTLLTIDATVRAAFARATETSTAPTEGERRAEASMAAYRAAVEEAGALGLP